MSPFFAVTSATVMIPMIGRLATRVARPTNRSTPHANSKKAVVGARTCGAGTPSEPKKPVTFSRLCSLPQPDWMNTQPSVSRATVGGSHFSAELTRSTSARRPEPRSAMVISPLVGASHTTAQFGSRSGSHELDEIGQIPPHRRDRRLQLLFGRTQAVDPIGGITERRRARRVPSRERRKHDLLAPQLQRVDPHPIRLPIGLVGADRVGAEDLLEKTVQLRVLD